MIFYNYYFKTGLQYYSKLRLKGKMFIKTHMEIMPLLLKLLQVKSSTSKKHLLSHSRPVPMIQWRTTSEEQMCTVICLRCYRKAVQLLKEVMGEHVFQKQPEFERQDNNFLHVHVPVPQIVSQLSAQPITVY